MINIKVSPPQTEQTSEEQSRMKTKVAELEQTLQQLRADLSAETTSREEAGLKLKAANEKVEKVQNLLNDVRGREVLNRVFTCKGFRGY